MTDTLEHRIVPLDKLERHHCGVVDHLEAGEADMERLMAMGVCTGRTVELIRTGDPLILKVFGSRIGVSARLASQVMVTPCGTRSCFLNERASDALL
jgi:Fe2+ transport system protein FeoA